DPCGEIVHWEPEPADTELNPLHDDAVEAMWPVDPLVGRRGEIERGARLVAEAMAAPPGDGPGDVQGDGRGEAPDGPAADWVADVDALLAERARGGAPAPVRLPTQLSVSALVELDRDPAAAARLTRRLPARPDPHATLGTAFHDWVQRFYGAERLFDLDDLPGAGDPQTADADDLAVLQDAFSASAWAARTPLDVEVPFELALGDNVIRGRIDAVFADPDGGVTVVDWKTGAPPKDAAARRHAAVQLAVYRLAWAGLTGRPVTEVRAAFHYVRAGRTVVPDTLYDAADLATLINPDAERHAESPARG
ncbi:MAG: PD-(D/E)XK nuclease family protein, partial [Mycobacterium sp.]|nr:PD-(D/E)XK nuclease family protein [Mycobacterium sp.]